MTAIVPAGVDHLLVLQGLVVPVEVEALEAEVRRVVVARVVVVEAVMKSVLRFSRSFFIL